MPQHRYQHVAYPGPPTARSTLPAVAPYLLSLMLRNVSSSGYSIADPVRPGRYSLPGAVIASPSYPQNLATIDQNYVFNWTRDAALTAMELAAAQLPSVEGVCGPLVDYVTFAARCQLATPTLARACYTVDGEPRSWSDQSDGPALQTSAVLLALPQLDATGRQTAVEVIARNVDFLLGAYRAPTTNLWEEVFGHSFYARAVQLRCFEDLIANDAGVDVPAGAAEARDWLKAALEQHWNGRLFVSVLSSDAAADPGTSVRSGYDPNIDVVLAALNGGISCTDPRILATAALLRQQWSDPSSPAYYPVNGADAGRGTGPMLGRYPEDSYDGDVSGPVVGGHPWPVSTAAFADLYYRVAADLAARSAILGDLLSLTFFAQVGVDPTTPVTEAVSRLIDAGDRMLSAVKFHSDHLQLSEQFDGTTGYEKSVANLTWSYASFLCALRSRSTVAPVQLG